MRSTAFAIAASACLFNATCIEAIDGATDPPRQVLAAYSPSTSASERKVLELVFMSDGSVRLGPYFENVEKCKASLSDRDLASLRSAAADLVPYVVEAVVNYDRSWKNEDVITLVFEAPETLNRTLLRMHRSKFPEALLPFARLVDDLQIEACGSDTWSMIDAVNQ